MELPASTPAGPRPPAPDSAVGSAPPLRVVDETPIVLDPGEPVVRLVQPAAPQHPSAPPLATPSAPTLAASSNVAPAPTTAPAPPAEEDGWGTSQPAPLRLWPWLAALALVAGAGLAVFCVTAWRRPANPADPAAAAPQVTHAAALEWYRLNPDVAEREARAVLEQYVAATTVDAVLPLLRDRTRVEPIVRDHWQPLASQLRPPGDAPQAAFSEVDGTAFFVLTAQLRDFRDLRAYFVREAGVMKLDWEATTAFSTVPAATLASAPDFHHEEIRCLVEARGVALPGYPSDRYNGYLIILPGSDEIFWGLARIGSQADEGVLNSLDRGRFLLELKQTERVTLELERAHGAGGNYFEITKFKHREWVRP